MSNLPVGTPIRKIGNIRDVDKFLDKLWPWDWVNDCFGGKIRPTDIDGTVERNGFFLYLEGKSIGQELPTGQEIYFKNLTYKLGHGTVALILWARIVGDPIMFQMIYEGKVSPIKNCTKEAIRIFCRKWYAHAESHGRFDAQLIK